MRIAQVAPLYEPVPPALYGGTERVVSYLTEELVRQGHEVTLFASGDSVTTARLVPACRRALWCDPECRDPLPHHVRLMELVFADVSRFDVIHFHCDFLHFPLLRREPCPSLTTLHGRLDAHDLAPLFADYRDIPLVSISDDQRRPLPWANWLGTVHHGLPADLYGFRDRPGGYLAFLGRMSPEKGVDRAIEIARCSGMPLKIAAKVYPEERAYYNAVLAPLIQESRSFVDFVGEVGGAEKEDFLAGAAALLFPITWPEPFGLVMIEAMACGTPVVAFRQGSVPEVMSDGVTGFIVADVDEAVRAVKRLPEISRRAVRRCFEDRYQISRVARAYTELYRRVVATTSATSVREPRRRSAALPGQHLCLAKGW